MSICRSFAILIGKLASKFSSRRAVSAVISAVILTGATIAMSFAVLSWSQFRSSEYQDEYGQAMNTGVAKLKERLALEFAFHNSTEKVVKLFLMNHGTVGLRVQVARLSNNTWYKTFADFTLTFLNGTSIPAGDLNVGEQGYITLALSPSSLKTGAYYYISLTTQRGSAFSWSFVA